MREASNLHGRRSVEVVVGEVLGEVDLLVFLARLERRSETLLAVVSSLTHRPVAAEVPARQPSQSFAEVLS